MAPAPAESGIYTIFDDQDRCSYLGKSDSETTTIRSRLQSPVRGGDSENTSCINGHSPAAFVVQTKAAILSGTVAGRESMYIQDYWNNEQGLCNEKHSL